MKTMAQENKLEFPMLLNIIIFHVNLIFLILLNNWSNFYDFFKKNVNVSLMLFLTEI